MSGSAPTCDAADELQGRGTVEGHRAPCLLVECLDGHRDHAAVGGDAVGRPAELCHRECRELPGRGRGPEVEHVHGALRAVHHEEPLAHGVERGDLGGAGAAARELADLLERDGRRRRVRRRSAIGGEVGRGDGGLVLAAGGQQ
jgi:hypothetical protein